MFIPLGTYTAFAYDKATRSCTSGFKELTKLAPPGMDLTNSIQIYTVPGKASLLAVSCVHFSLHFSSPLTQSEQNEYLHKFTHCSF